MIIIKSKQFKYYFYKDIFFLIFFAVFTIAFFSTVNLRMLSPEWNISAATQTIGALVALIIAGYSFNNQTIVKQMEDNADIDEEYKYVQDENFFRFTYVIFFSSITIIYNLLILLYIKNGYGVTFSDIEQTLIHVSLTLSVSVIVIIGLFTTLLFDHKRVIRVINQRTTKYDANKNGNISNLNIFLKEFNTINNLINTYYKSNYNSNNNYLNPNQMYKLLGKDDLLKEYMQKYHEMRNYRNKIVHSNKIESINNDSLIEIKKLRKRIEKLLN